MTFFEILATIRGMESPKVAVIMGSDSDWPILISATDVIESAGVVAVSEVISAHRTPEKMMNFALEAKATGYSVIIAGAGGAAHLPGMVAACTTLPVIGVPIPLSHLDGLDSLMSIVQMPSGVPVATVGIGQGANAGLLALRMLAVQFPDIANFLENYATDQRDSVLNKKLPR